MLGAAKSIQIARDASDSWHSVFPCDACAITLISKRIGVFDCGLIVSSHRHQFQYLPIDIASFPAQCHQRLNRSMDSVATKAIARRGPVLESFCSLLLVLELGIWAHRTTIATKTCSASSGPWWRHSKALARAKSHGGIPPRDTSPPKGASQACVSVAYHRCRLAALLFQYATVQASPRQPTVFRRCAMSQDCAVPHPLLCSFLDPPTLDAQRLNMSMFAGVPCVAVREALRDKLNAFAVSR